MSEAKLDITGNTDVAQRNIDKLTKDVAKLREQVRQMNQEAVKGAKESAKGLDAWAVGLEKLKASQDKWAQGMRVLESQSRGPGKAGRVPGFVSRDLIDESTAALAGMASKVFTVAAAVGLVRQGFASWQEKIDGVIQSHENLSTAIVRTLAETGKLSLGPQAEAFAKNVKGATPQQAIAALGGVRMSGETLSDQRAFAVAGQIAQLAPTGMDMTGGGKLAADVADILGEGTSAQDVADITVGLKQQLREKTEQFSSPKFQRQLERMKASKKMTGEEALAYGVAALQSEQGVEALHIYGKKGAKSREERLILEESFGGGKVQEIQKQIAGFRTGDVAAQQLEALGQFGAGREAISEQAIAEEQAKTTQAYGPQWSALDRAKRFIRERAYQRSGFRGAVTDVQFGLNRYMGADAALGPQAAGEFEIGRAQNAGLITAGEAKELIAALRDNTVATKANTPSRVNVDAHTE